MASRRMMENLSTTHCVGAEAEVERMLPRQSCVLAGGNDAL